MDVSGQGHGSRRRGRRGPGSWKWGLRPRAGAGRLDPRLQAAPRPWDAAAGAGAPHCEKPGLRGSVSVHECRQTDVWAPREENTALPRRRPPRSRPQGLTKCGERHVKKHISVKCPKIFQRRERFQGRKRNLNEHRQNVDQISMLWIWAIGPSLRDNEQTAASLGNQELGGRPGQGPEDIWPSGSSGCPPRETAGESDRRRHVHTQPAGGFICETSLDLPTRYQVTISRQGFQKITSHVGAPSENIFTALFTSHEIALVNSPQTQCAQCSATQRRPACSCVARVPD